MSKEYGNNDQRGVFKINFELDEKDTKFVKEGLKRTIKKVNSDYSRNYELQGADFQPVDSPNAKMKVDVSVKGDYRAMGVVTDYILRVPGVSSVNVSYPFRKLRKP